MSLIKLPYIYEMDAIKKRGRKSFVYGVVAHDLFEICDVDYDELGYVEYRCNNIRPHSPIINEQIYKEGTDSYFVVKDLLRHMDMNYMSFLEGGLGALEQDMTTIIEEWKEGRNPSSLHEIIQVERNAGLKIDEDDIDDKIKKIFSDNKEKKKKDISDIMDKLICINNGKLAFKSDKKNYICLKLNGDYGKKSDKAALFLTGETKHHSGMNLILFPVEMIDAVRLFLEKNDITLILKKDSYISTKNLEPEHYEESLKALIQVTMKNLEHMVKQYAKIDVPDCNSFIGENVSLDDLKDYFEMLKTMSKPFQNKIYLPYQSDEIKVQRHFNNYIDLMDTWINSIYQCEENIKNNQAAVFLDSSGFVFPKVEHNPQINM